MPRPATTLLSAALIGTCSFSAMVAGQSVGQWRTCTGPNSELRFYGVFSAVYSGGKRQDRVDTARLYRLASDRDKKPVWITRIIDSKERLCFGDRLETWHTARLILHKLGADDVIESVVTVEGGAMLELGDPIRQFYGAATYFGFSYDDFIVDVRNRPLVDVRPPGVSTPQQLTAAKSTYRIEVQGPQSKAATLAVSDLSDPFAGDVQLRHGISFRSRDGRGRVEERWLEGPSVAKVDLRGEEGADEDPFEIMDTTFPEWRPQIELVNKAHNEIISTLGTLDARPELRPTLLSPQLPAWATVWSERPPSKMELNGHRVPAGAWRFIGEGVWTTELRDDVQNLDRLSVWATDSEPPVAELTLLVEDSATLLPVPSTAECPARQIGRPSGVKEVVESWSPVKIEFFGMEPTFLCVDGSPSFQDSGVELAPFFLGRTEVTQAQWRGVVSRGQQQKIPDAIGLLLEPSQYRGEDLPVERVSWCDTIRFSNVLSELHGRAPAYLNADACEAGRVRLADDSNGYRLPTEAEWWYVAWGAGRSTPPIIGGDARICNTANIADESFLSQDSIVPNVAACDDGAPYTAMVCGFSTRPWGFCDMIGNVWEWTWDSVTTGQDSASKVVRGGAWTSPPQIILPTTRSSRPLDERVYDVGFRLAFTGR